MLAVESAQRLIFKNTKTLAPGVVSLDDALGTVLAENLYAKESIPFWHNSAVDGVAIRSRDVQRVSSKKPMILKVTGTIFAGDSPKILHISPFHKGGVRGICPGEAIKIMTGAPLPSGADAVVMQEHIKVRSPMSEVRSLPLQAVSRGQRDVILACPESEVRIMISRPVRKWENVRKKGEDVRKGEIVLRCGTKLTPSALGLCAALGYAKIRVLPKPKIALFSTGKELLKVQEKLKPGKIRDSNSWILKALAQELGLESQILGIAKDSPKDIRNKLEKGFQNADVVISSGGVSVGEADHVQKVLKEMGAKIVFWKVAMKPGKPFLFALFKNKPFFGLPGNPVSAFVTFHLFVRPAILKLSGRQFSLLPDTYARLASPLKLNSSRRSFLRGFLYPLSPFLPLPQGEGCPPAGEAGGEGGMRGKRVRGQIVKPRVRILTGQGSHQLSTLARANCLVDIPAGKINYPKGKLVPILLLNSHAF